MTLRGTPAGTGAEGLEMPEVCQYLLTRIGQKDRFDFDLYYLSALDYLEHRGFIESYKDPIISPAFGPCWRITPAGRAALSARPSTAAGRAEGADGGGAL